MNIKLKQVFFTLSIVGVTLLSSNVYSQPPGEHFNRHQEMREKMRAKKQEAFKQLDLSPEQERLIQAHRENHRGQKSEFQENMRVKKEAIRNELQKEEFNLEKIHAIHNELKNLILEKADHRLNGILEVRKILTAEQFRKFCELRKEMRPMKGRRKGFY
ncbi:P pilus assembly/Cpx signaling pathway, periplasmic inhibitor/zinc-resistance associated protein [Candidatus Scalindua japonica]|uniref:P pilus assembly/Cpx signaling pathway, periplasmic inhibitor/zinc-resistance associated protein n=1 Tax=Candidatus Scalindua japonica TaxID=1284222 RepID=A0A286TYJ5_9BACT|nr:periplasmic heavy metal sensor [Candidatus Scalindua japonica]GAX60965.1 P pilus assembly/Cpx signaling pathway, periplasmic inhibitor/zinc-resistance associated protein [Candidatus Scalindua japonica]